MTRSVRYEDAWVQVDAPLGSMEEWTLPVPSATVASHQITCTASATPHTKGPWTTVVASTAANYQLISLQLAAIVALNTGNGSTLLDIGIGGAGSESVIVANLPVGYCALGTRFDIPVAIPSGSRVAVRCQGAVASQTVPAIYSFGIGDPAPSSLVTMGANTAASKGVDLSTAAINTYGAWTEIEDSTTVDLAGLLVGMQGAAGTSMNSSNGYVVVQLGVGAAASEVVIHTGMVMVANSAEYYNHLSPHIQAVAIPAGSRIAARFSRGNIANLVDVVALGMPA